jgi:hypothetical protein
LKKFHVVVIIAVAGDISHWHGYVSIPLNDIFDGGAGEGTGDQIIELEGGTGW